MSKLNIEAIEGSRLALKKVNALLTNDSLSDSTKSQTFLIDAHLQLELVISLFKNEAEIQTTESDLVKLLDARDDLSKLWENSKSTKIMSQQEFEESLSSLFKFLDGTMASLSRQSELLSSHYIVDLSNTERSTTRVQGTIENLKVLRDDLNNMVDQFADQLRLGWKDHEVFLSQLEIKSPISVIDNRTVNADKSDAFLTADLLQENMPLLSRAMEINYGEVDHESRRSAKSFFFMFISWACSDELMGEEIAKQKRNILNGEALLIDHFAVVRQKVFDFIEEEYRLMFDLSGMRFTSVEEYSEFRVEQKRKLEAFFMICADFPIMGIGESLNDYRGELFNIPEKKRRKAAKVLEPYLEDKPLRQLLHGQAIPVELGKITQKLLPPLPETSAVSTELNYDTAPKGKVSQTDDSENESAEVVELVEKSNSTRQQNNSRTEISRTFNGLATRIVRIFGWILAATGVVMALLCSIGAVAGDADNRVIGLFLVVIFMGVAWLGFRMAKSSRSTIFGKGMIEESVVSS